MDVLVEFALPIANLKLLEYATADLNMILTALSFLARLGALAASIIVLGLGAKFITNIAFNTAFLVYIEVIAATSVLGALIPPYPNFLYELFWGLAWLLASIFALVVQVRTFHFRFLE